MARMNVLADIAKGLKANIHVVDNLSPVSRVAVYVKAGSRYEPNHLPGISHYIRASAGLTTLDSSIFGIARHMERAGATFNVTSDREYIVYSVSCLRDRLGYVLSFIDDTIHRPEFRSWELVDIVQPRLQEELSRFKRDQNLVTNEALHKAAFRGGLAHSMFTPEHQIKKFNRDNLFEFLEKNYVLDRMSFVGLSVDESDLRGIIEEKFRLNGSEFKGVSGESRYVAGEVRIQADFPHTQVNFVVQGSSIIDLKTIAALELIGFLIGSGETVPIKYGRGTDRTLSSLLTKISPQFKSSIVNQNYTDTGLFGISITGPNELMNMATKHAVNHVRTVLGSIKENDLKIAKKAAKVKVLLQSENQEAVFKAMCHRHAAGIVGKSALDLVDELTIKDIQAVANNLLKSKPTIAVVGNPRFVPYIDELD